MLNVYDLYDLHTIIVNIRCCPDNMINRGIVCNVINTLKDKSNTDFNQFRKAVRHFVEFDKEGLYDFALVDNKYCYSPLPFLKDERIYFVLIKAFEKLLEAFSENNIEKVYDLADCIHDLPIIIVDNKYSIPKKFWKNEIKFYRKKWDEAFLLKEQFLFR